MVQRVPSLLLGLLSWVLLRAYVARALPAGTGRGRAIALHAVVAVAFVAWWLPYDVGVRAEAVVATSVIASLLCLRVALERDRWFLAGLAVGVASFGATAAPTGFVALAPLLALLPAVWRRLAEVGSLPRRSRRWSPSPRPGRSSACSRSPTARCATSSGPSRSSSGMQAQETWYSEIVRWSFLLDDGGPMGNYAKRYPVLLGVLALGCLLALVALARGRGLRLPPRFAAAGWTLLLGFALLWLTPSKWTHHFGTLATVGPAVLALVVVGAPVLLRDAVRRRAGGPGWPGRSPLRPPLPVMVGVGLLVVVLAALAGHGDHNWPYSWMLGLPDAFQVPPRRVLLLRPAACGGCWAAWSSPAVDPARGHGGGRPPGGPWRPVVAVVADGGRCAAGVHRRTSSAASSLATARTADGVLALGRRGARPARARLRRGVARSRSSTPRTARPLLPPAALPGVPSRRAAGWPSAFVPGGWFPSSPPPTTGAAAWGSFVPPTSGPGSPRAPTARSARFSTPWYAIPPRPGAAMTAVGRRDAPATATSCASSTGGQSRRAWCPSGHRCSGSTPRATRRLVDLARAAPRGRGRAAAGGHACSASSRRTPRSPPAVGSR